MNKRITSLLLCFVMVFAMLATAVPALAASITSTQLKVSPNKTKVSPGDIITYSIVMGPVSDLGSLMMDLEIPEGLEYVANSGEIVNGITEAMGFDEVAFTEITKRITGYSTVDYECTTDTKLAEFRCKVKDSATGNLEVGLSNLEFGSCITFKYHTDRFSVVKTPVTITAAVTGVTIDETLSVNIGESKTPSYEVLPAGATNKTVKFTTSDASVATVNATTGEVTGVKKGTATITIKTEDGEFTDTCTVTVSCSHANKSTVPEKNSTCADKGWDAYKKCDDCGQLFDTSDNEISAIPFRALAAHTGGTATCTQKAVCTVCHQPYGDYAAHSYTADTKKAEALKTAGTCKNNAVYYYSCSVCGAVEHNDAHTFNGDKDAANHAGGTSTVNASEPDHKNQVAGYTGDTKCLGCGEIIAHGTAIAPGDHVPTSTWNSDDTNHWKSCTVAGCGVVIDGTKAPHSSTGTNAATCQHKAVCDVCNVEYGEKAAHNPASGWSNDASGHWHACQTAGCTEKCDFAAHTPDHEGHATEEYAIKCTKCGHVIEAQLGHTHVFNKEVATDVYKATNATCTAKATYYKSCACGEKGTETFVYGELAPHNWTPATCTAPKTCSDCGATEGDALGHTEGTEWKSDADNHWHVCTVAGCGVVIESSKAAHTPDREAATETEPVKCSVCGYIITPALGHTHDVDTAKFESDETNHWNTCSGCSEKQNVAAHEFEWKIDKEATATEKGSKHEECKVCGYKKAAVEIPATGTPTEPTKPTDPQSPQTGDSSNMVLWIALLFVSGAGVAGTTVFSRKRRSTR